MTRLGDSEWFVHQSILEKSFQQNGGCVVYSIGVAERDAYTTLMAARGCQVIALDPTVEHPTHWMPNVTFYPWGLRSNSDDDNGGKGKHQVWSHPVYGKITNTSVIYSLPTIIEKLGHHHSKDTKAITAMKLDCEGCEFAAFEDLVTSSTRMPPIRMLDVEFHFASTLGMANKLDVARMYYAHIYLKQNKCQLVRHRRHAGFEVDRDKVPSILVSAGVSSHHCCYEMTYVCGVDD
eukprot:Sro1298_g260610.2  (235) ;mRNA; r:14678-15382